MATRFDGSARFVDAHAVEVDGQTYTASHTVIAIGGRPIVPPMPGAKLGITSDGFFEPNAQTAQKPWNQAVANRSRGVNCDR